MYIYIHILNTHTYCITHIRDISCVSQPASVVADAKMEATTTVPLAERLLAHRVSPLVQPLNCPGSLWETILNWLNYQNLGIHFQTQENPLQRSSCAAPLLLLKAFQIRLRNGMPSGPSLASTEVAALVAGPQGRRSGAERDWKS